MSGRKTATLRTVAGLALGAAALGVAALGVAAPGTLAAQTPVTSAGLGYPVPPLDARAAALGGTGVGLLDGTFSLRNPADLTQHRNAGISTSLAPEALSVQSADGSLDTGRNRFSVLRFVLPLDDWRVGVGFGAELDQDWDLRFQDTLQTTAGLFPFEEARRHDGGLSSIDLSLARRIGPLSLGVSGQRLTGSLRQTFTRRFEPQVGEEEQDTLTLRSVGAERSLSYRGWRLRSGASLHAGDRVLLSGAVSWAPDLQAVPDDPAEPTRSFEMPVTVEAGGSARLAPWFLLTGAGGWSGWSSVGEVQAGIEAHDVRWAGAGLEVTGWRFLGADVPLRVGGRLTELPFAPAGLDQSVERALTFGLGARFRGGLAELDAAFEVGRRGDLPASGFEESFRRLTFTFAVRQ